MIFKGKGIYIFAIFLYLLIFPSILNAQRQKTVSRQAVTKKTVKKAASSQEKTFYFMNMKMKTSILKFKALLLQKGYKYECGNENDDYPIFQFSGKRKDIKIYIYVYCGYKGQNVYKIDYIEEGFLSWKEAQIRQKQFQQTVEIENGRYLGHCRYDRNVMVWNAGTLSFREITKSWSGDFYRISAEVYDRYSTTRFFAQCREIGSVLNYAYEQFPLVETGCKILNSKDLNEAYGTLKSRGLTSKSWNKNDFERQTKNCTTWRAFITPECKTCEEKSKVKCVRFNISQKHLNSIFEDLAKMGFHKVYHLAKKTDIDISYKDDNGHSMDSTFVYRRGDLYIRLVKRAIDEEIEEEEFFRKKHQDLESGIFVEEDFNIIEFADSMYRLNDFEGVSNIIKSHPSLQFAVVEEDSYSASFKRNTESKEQLIISREDNKLPDLSSIEVKLCLDDYINLEEDILLLGYTYAKEEMMTSFEEGKTVVFVSPSKRCDMEVVKDGNNASVKFKPHIPRTSLEFMEIISNIAHINNDASIRSMFLSQGWKIREFKSLGCWRSQYISPYTPSVIIVTTKKKKKAEDFLSVSMKLPDYNLNELFKKAGLLGYEYINTDTSHMEYTYGWIEYNFGNKKGFRLVLDDSRDKETGNDITIKVYTPLKSSKK